MDTSKREFLKTLNNVVVVLGNGFDLHCGLHSRYLDFYKYSYDKTANILFWFELFQQNQFSEVNDYHVKIEKYTIWDVFFALNYKEEGNVTTKNWFDIEKLILSSLISEDDVKNHREWSHLKLDSVVDWNQIKQYYIKGTQCLTDENQFVAKIFRYKAGLRNYPDFFEFLLDELKLFEQEFGKFIESQIKSDYLSNQTKCYPYNKKYFDNAISTIQKFSLIEKISRIDTFNYSYILGDLVKDKIHHINGTIDHPIFGVDSIYFKPSDKRFIFTKTARRMDADTANQNISYPAKIENIIIYGHSLNDADFNYYFPLFDKINLLDPQASGTVVFVFTVFDPNKETQIRTDTRERLSHILYEYAKSKNGEINAERFLDSLTTQGRVFVSEIPKIEASYINSFDEEWDKIEKRYELIKSNLKIALFN